MEKAAAKSTKLTKPQAKQQAKKPKTDWEAVERDYRASQMTLREIAFKHGCSHGRIVQRAKEKEWSRDLSGAIKQATDAKLIEASVNSLLTSKANQANQDLTNVVMVAAEANTQVILGHRAGLRRITNVRDLLLDQIEQAATHMADLAEVVEMVRNPDENGVDRANDALRKVLGRSALVDDLKKLADVDEKVRKGEREAFSIDSTPQKEADAFTTLLQKISTGNNSAFQPVQQDPAHGED